jgi:hypothetical protein
VFPLREAGRTGRPYDQRPQSSKPATENHDTRLNRDGTHGKNHGGTGAKSIRRQIGALTCRRPGQNSKLARGVSAAIDRAQRRGRTWTARESLAPVRSMAAMISLEPSAEILRTRGIHSRRTSDVVC